MGPLWRDDEEPEGTAPPEPGEQTDVAIIGAGLTGLATAWELLQAGRGVCVLEAGTIGGLASGANTGKATVLQGTLPARIRRRYDDTVLRGYVAGNAAGLARLREIATESDVPLRETTAVTFAATPAGRRSVEAAYDAALAAGLPARLLDAPEEDLDLPFHRGVALDGQVTVQPHRLVRALAEAVVRRGGALHTGVRVTGVRSGDPVRVETTAGLVLAHDVVLATGAPILDRGGHFAQLSPGRSHLVALEADVGPEALYLSVGGADGVSRSIAPATGVETTPGRRTFLVGRGGHPVGRADELAHRAELARWARRTFAGARLVRTWAAQDYSPVDLLPVVGRMPFGGGRVWMATGYSKWGLTNSFAAAQRIATALTDAPPAPWMTALDRASRTVSGVRQGVTENARIGVAAARGWVGAAVRGGAAPPPEGTGVVRRQGVRPVAVSTVEGRTCAVSAVCPHLGGILSWNTAEHTWDCPLHGSRFTPEGTRIEGPALRDLDRTD